MKKAYLVYFYPATRVVVDEGATEEEIIEKAKPKIRHIVENEFSDNIEKIEEDLEQPYDPKTDDPLPKQYLLIENGEELSLSLDKIHRLEYKGIVYRCETCDEHNREGDIVIYHISPGFDWQDVYDKQTQILTRGLV